MAVVIGWLIGGLCMAALVTFVLASVGMAAWALREPPERAPYPIAGRRAGHAPSLARSRTNWTPRPSGSRRARHPSARMRRP